MIIRGCFGGFLYISMWAKAKKAQRYCYVLLNLFVFRTVNSTLLLAKRCPTLRSADPWSEADVAWNIDPIYSLSVSRRCDLKPRHREYESRIYLNTKFNYRLSIFPHVKLCVSMFSAVSPRLKHSNLTGLVFFQSFATTSSSSRHPQ